MALNLTMRAVLWTGIANNITVANVPLPTLQAPGDAIIKVSAAGICGTDLHTYHGTLGPVTPPWILGHEAVGVVSEIAEGVQAVKVGDKVVVPDQIALGSLNLKQPSPEIEIGGFFGSSAELQGCQGKLSTMFLGHVHIYTRQVAHFHLPQ
jgi:threonine dehydrogenase-like Zn-dependent dehydrogenase